MATKYKLGARAAKYKLWARAGKYKLGARAGKYKLGARTRARAGDQAKGQGLGNTKTHEDLLLGNRTPTLNVASCLTYKSFQCVTIATILL